MSIVTSGLSEAAKILEQIQRSIDLRCRYTVTLSRQQALDAVWEVWQETEEGSSTAEGKMAISQEVRDTVIRFVEALPLAFPQPSISAELDGHINLEWYRNPRRVVSVSVAPSDRLHWTALIGSESPRGSARFINHIPESILRYIARIFQR